MAAFAIENAGKTAFLIVYSTPDSGENNIAVICGPDLKTVLPYVDEHVKRYTKSKLIRGCIVHPFRQESNRRSGMVGFFPITAAADDDPEFAEERFVVYKLSNFTVEPILA